MFTKDGFRRQSKIFKIFLTRIISFFSLFLSISFTAGCASSPFLVVEDVPVETIPIHCAPPRPHLPSDVLSRTESKGKNEVSRSKPVATHLSAMFSPTALRIAKPLGIIPLLEELVTLEARRTQGQQKVTLQLLLVREKVVNRIMVGTLKVASAAAEAACEEDRAERAAARLLAAENVRAKRQVQIALVSAGLASILGGALSLSTTDPTPGAAISITSGVIETLFGGAPLYNVTRQGFSHPRNMLQELWDNPPQSEIFPEPVWLYLNIEQVDDPKHRSLREHLIDQWYGKGRLGEKGSQEEQKRLKLFLSKGGIYETEDLVARAAILSRLATAIRLMYQEIDILMGEFMSRQVIIEDKLNNSQ